jgi:hypothetical protein
MTSMEDLDTISSNPSRVNPSTKNSSHALYPTDVNPFEVTQFAQDYNIARLQQSTTKS